MNKKIKLVTNNKTASGFNNTCLFMGDDGTELVDCGMLYLSDTDLKTLTELLQSGIRSSDNNHVFESEDNTQLAIDY